MKKIGFTLTFLLERVNAKVNSRKKPSRKCKNVLSFPRDISNADFAILIIKTQKKNNIH